ncbi:MAG: globin [Pseudomonadales bacterium]|jgi:hypothetical protein|nr:globin [Pseudomonadales bacterium]
MSESGQVTVEAMLERVAELGVDPGPAFWSAYFAASPEAGARMEHMDEHMRGRMLASVFDLLMIEDQAERRALLAFEIGNHDAYGASLPMYEALFQALHAALRSACGPAWSAQWDRAWGQRANEILVLVAAFTRRT